MNFFTRKLLTLRILLIFLAVLFLAQGCSLTGSSKKQGPPVELVWWKPFDDPRYIQPLIEAFQKDYPNVRITFVQKDIETYEDDLVEALASGSGPDIFSIHNDWLPKHKEKIVPAPGNLLSLREFRENFVEVASFDLTEGNEVYALPLATDVLALYYNKDILSSAGIARPPATWEEVLRYVPQITRQDNLGNFQRSAVAMGTADNINRSPDILSLLMLQNNTTFYDPTRSLAVFDQVVKEADGTTFSPGARALEFYTQFANPAKVTYNWNNRSNNSIEEFAGGRVAMIFSYSYLRPVLAGKAPFLNYGIASVPQISVEGNRVNFANYWAESVSKQGKNQEVAWQFLKYISAKDVLAKYYEVQKQVSSRIDILEEQISDPDIGVFAENALSAKDFYKPDSDAMESVFMEMINDVVSRNISPGEAIRSAVQKVNLLLRKK